MKCLRGESKVYGKGIPTLAIMLILLGMCPYGSPAEDHQNGSEATFKVNSRLVVVDVVANDSGGKPIREMKSKDFAVIEDGKPQSIVAFEEHSAEATPKTNAAEVHLGANEYTNYLTRTDSDALTVLLLDSLNGSQQDLTFGKRELLNYIKNLPRGKKIALYNLGAQLRLVQNFTDDSDVLIAAAQKLSAKSSSVYANNKDVSATVAELRQSGLAKNPRVFRSMLETLGEDYQAKEDTRSLDSLEALTQLARALAVVPGRKNLIWISAGFPFDPQRDAARLQKISALLAVSRIAVYPVDVRGVQAMSATGETSSTELFGSREAYETSSGQYQENLSVVETLQTTAQLTGGHAYVNRNDVHKAIGDAADSSASYYTVAYRSSNNDWNGKYRKITIKSTRAGARLLYRNGYYAVVDPLNTTESPDQAVALAMQEDAPNATQFIFKTRVVPPSQAGKPILIDMLIDAHDLSVVTSGDTRIPEVQFVGVAWDGNGKQAANFSATFKEPISNERWQTMMRTGIQLHRELTLPAGSFQLRLGVVDRRANRVGTLDVPVTIPATHSTH